MTKKGNDTLAPTVGLTFAICDKPYDAGKEYLVENSAASGRSPKLWDTCWAKKHRKRTGARIIAVAMCEWGKAPKDAPEKRYRKLTWWMVSSRLYPYVRGLARRCSGQHVHVPLQGKNPDGINRTTEAAAYSPELCKGFAKAIKAASEGRPVPP